MSIQTGGRSALVIENESCDYLAGRRAETLFLIHEGASTRASRSSASEHFERIALCVQSAEYLTEAQHRVPVIRGLRLP
jgi:hypothetical protein